MVYVYAVVLTLVNLLCWVGILFGLPGTWLMVLFSVLLKWWQPDQFMVSWTVLGGGGGPGRAREVLEFVLGAAEGGAWPHGAQSWQSSVVSSVGLWLSAASAACGHHAGRVPRGLCRCATREPVGRTHAVPELRGGPGAAIGWFWGTVAKLAIGAIIAVMLVIAALV